MTPTLTAVLASAIVVLAALLLYVRHVVRQEIHAAEERLRDDLIATRIISSPPEPPVPRPRPALRYIKGGAVALFGLAAGTLAWARRHAALTAVTAGGLAAIVVLPQAGPPDVEGLPQAIPPSASSAPSSPPANDPPTDRAAGHCTAADRGPGHRARDDGATERGVSINTDAERGAVAGWSTAE